MLTSWGLEIGEVVVMVTTEEHDGLDKACELGPAAEACFLVRARPSRGAKVVVGVISKAVAECGDCLL